MNSRVPQGLRLEEAIPVMPQRSRLAVRSLTFSSYASFAELAPKISRAMPNIIELTLTTTNDARDIDSLVAFFPRLQRLTLAGNSLCAFPLLTRLLPLQQLAALDITDHPDYVHSRSRCSLEDFIFEGFSSIEHIRWKTICPMAPHLIARASNVFSRLQHMTLIVDRIESELLQAEFCALSWLSLDAQNSVSLIRQPMRVSQQLKKLSLKLGNGSAGSELRLILSRFPHLTDLDIDCERHALHYTFADEVRSLTHLRFFRLRDDGWTMRKHKPRGVDVVVQLLRNLPSTCEVSIKALFLMEASYVVRTLENMAQSSVFLRSVRIESFPYFPVKTLRMVSITRADYDYKDVMDRLCRALANRIITKVPNWAHTLTARNTQPEPLPEISDEVFV